MLLICLILFTVHPQLAAGVDTSVGKDDVEVVEDVVAVPVASEVGKPRNTLTVIGRLHPVLIHFPIALLYLLLIVEIGAFCLRLQRFKDHQLEYYEEDGRNRKSVASSPVLEIVARWVVIGAALSFVPAAATGFLRAGELPSSEAVDILWHRNAALAAAVLTLTAAVLRTSTPAGKHGTKLYVYYFLLISGALLIALAGHMGGELVYGEDYLPF